MAEDIDISIERFDTAFFVIMHNLGPQLISRVHFGLTPGQVFTLYFIRKESQCTVSRLAEKMEVNPSAITVMLDRLESHGFVVRTRDDHDRRMVIVHLTDAGHRALDKVLNARKQIVHHCLTQISSEELDSFLTTLETLAHVSATMDIKTILSPNNLEG